MKTLIYSMLITIVLSSCTNTNKTGITLLPENRFDTTLNNERISLYTLKNENGLTAQITNYGARVVALWVPAKDNTFKDVVWGYESISDYLNAGDRFSGPIVGRFGNRIANGRFSINGKEYQLPLNDNGNHLHGGPEGFWNKIWKAKTFKNEKNEEALELSYLSPDGEAGYPGNLSIKVIYALTADNSLSITYEATTDSSTIINPTSHIYFNLHGTSANSTNSHLLTINADQFTPTDSVLIPTGELASVENTPLDFRQATPIGDRINGDFEALRFGQGYDHNFIINKSDKPIRLAAEVFEPATGIVMQVSTDQPGMQFYSGNFMDGKDTGKRGDKHNYRTGIALETQNFPDAPNHPDFPSAILNPDETYTQTCIYSFSIRK